MITFVTSLILKLYAMKKKSFTLLMAATLGCSIMFSSCIGSFNLTNKLLSWNQGIGDKFVNELVFVAFWIIPVYEVSALADVLVINSIEFWTGRNAVADNGKVKNVETENGNYAIETTKDGYHIQKEGEQKDVDLVFNEDEQTWSVESGAYQNKLMRFDGEDKVVMYLPDGNEMEVELSEAGVLAFKQVAEGYTYYAAK